MSYNLLKSIASDIKNILWNYYQTTAKISKILDSPLLRVQIRLTYYIKGNDRSSVNKTGVIFRCLKAKSYKKISFNWLFQGRVLDKDSGMQA